MQREIKRKKINKRNFFFEQKFKKKNKLHTIKTKRTEVNERKYKLKEELT